MTSTKHSSTTCSVCGKPLSDHVDDCQRLVIIIHKPRSNTIKDLLIHVRHILYSEKYKARITFWSITNEKPIAFYVYIPDSFINRNNTTAQ